MMPVTANHLRSGDRLVSGHVVKFCQLCANGHVFITWADGHAGEVSANARYLIWM